MADEDPAAIDALLITHEHQDHVQGVSVLARKLGVPVYFTQATHRAWMRWMMPQKRLTYAAWLARRQQDLARRQAAEATPETAVPVARGSAVRRRVSCRLTRGQEGSLQPSRGGVL